MSTNLIHQIYNVVPETNDVVTLHYGLRKNDLDDLKKFINGTIGSGATFDFNNPSELIISIRAYPFWMKQFYSIGSRDYFPIGRFKKNEVKVYGSKLTFQQNHISLGTYTFARTFNNYMDYAPYTRIDMYLPAGFGFVSLNVNEVMGKTIDIRASMDFDNGIMTIFIVVEDVVIQTFERKIGIDISLTQTNNLEQSRNRYLGIMSTLIGGGTDIYSKNKSEWNTQAVGVGLSGATSLYRQLEHHVHAGSIGSGRNELVAPTSIYFIIQRPNPVPIDDNYLRTNGKPLGDYRTLSTLTGYTEVESIHLDGFDEATQTEINEIDTLLRNGVHL